LFLLSLIPATSNQFAMSLPENEKRSVDAGVTASTSGESTSVLFPLSFSHRLARAHQLGHVQGIPLSGYDDLNFNPIAMLLEAESLYNSGLLSPTQMILRRPLLFFMLWSSVSFVLSFSLVPISSLASDTLPL
jgi:hypothetical protein